MTSPDGRKPRVDSPFLDAPLLAEAEAEAEAERADNGLRSMRLETPYLASLEAIGHRYAPEPDAVGLTQDEKGIIGGHDDRKRVHDTLAVPFRWICSIAVQRRITYASGRVSTTGLAPAGTGVLISPRHVLTAAHVLRSVTKDDRGGITERHEAQFVAAKPGRDGDSAPFGEIEATSWETHPKWDPETGAQNYDYAIITLKQAVGDRVFDSLNGRRLGFWGSPRDGAGTSLDNLPAPLAANLIGARVITAGYPSKNHREMQCSAGQLSGGSPQLDAILTRDGRVEQWARAAQIVSVTADATEGQSGSPVWIVDQGHRYLVGILVGAGDAYNQVVFLNANAMRQIRAWTGTAAAAGQVREREDEPPWRDEAAGEEGSPAESSEELDEVELAEVEDPEVEDPEVDDPEVDDPEVGTLDEIDEVDAADEIAEIDAARRKTPRRSRWRVPDGFVPDLADEAMLEHDGSEVDEALAKGDWAKALQAAIDGGERDENKLANLVFFARHKDLDPSLPLDSKGGKADQKLAREWLKIRNKEVWAAVQRSAENTVLGVHGKDVVGGQHLFWSPAGKRFKQLVEWAAQEVDLDPGLLAAAVIAEIGEIGSYLSASKVSSYYIGIDDFYAMRHTLAAKVPAYAKIKWDKKQTPWVHPNDAQTHPRDVKTIEFDSGRDALLATAVYLKYAEVRLREDATQAGGDFDKLPIETRFALIRMSMAAGRAGAEKRLVRALKGEDILVRNFKPAAAYHTDRNATIRAAQALHLSDWIFGNKRTATQPEVGSDDESDDAPDREIDDEIEDEIDEGFDAVADFEGDTRDDGNEIEEALWRDPEDDETSVAFERDGNQPSVREVVVGERIVLDLNAFGFAGSIDKVSWTIPGRAVRGYDGTVNNAKLFELTATDLGQPKITFFWVDAGDGRSVRAKIRTTSGTDRELVLVFDVKGPTLVSFTGTPDHTRFEKRGGLRGMRLGKLVVAPGIKWSWKVTMPAKHAGHIKDVQTIVQDRKQILALAPGSADTRTLVYRHPSRTAQHVQLDGDADGEAGYTPGLHEPTHAAGETFADTTTSDSPHTSLPSLARTVAVNDQFTYFILFKPDTPNPQDAIWVPVAKATWFWTATAKHRGKRWTLASETKMKRRTGKATTDFPLYDTNVAKNEWQEVSP